MNMTLDWTDKTAVRNVVVWTNPLMEKTPKLASFLIAAVIHAVLLMAAGFVFVSRPHYGIDQNQGGMDVYLVAAPARPAAAEIQSEKFFLPAAQDKSEMLMPVSETKTAAVPEDIKKQIQNTAVSENQGDGSSSAAGMNNTTLSSAGSGRSESKPGYLKNPPPVYPAEAVRKGQEGIVYVAVVIDKRGKVISADIAQTSGYPLLDDSALKSVKKWKFSPARMGNIAVETRETIPVRFKLEDAKR